MTLAEAMEPRLVRIDWQDVMSLDLGLIQGVRELDDFSPCTASIVGFLIHETDEAYYLAKEYWAKDNGFKYVHVIPKKTAILRIVELVASKHAYREHRNGENEE